MNDELAKSLEIALVELQHLRQVKRLSDEQIAALEAKISALDDLVNLERERANAYKAAAAERATANTLDDARIKLFEQMIADYKVEVVRLRKERDKARSANKFYLAVGVVLGALAAIFANRN